MKALPGARLCVALAAAALAAPAGARPSASAPAAVPAEEAFAQLSIVSAELVSRSHTFVEQASRGGAHAFRRRGFFVGGDS